MPVRIPLISDPAARVLLDGIVDYAGVFPPSALSLHDAVHHYARYRGGESGWMLGRFVCPVQSLGEFSEVAEPLLPRDAGALPWRLAAIGTGDHAADSDAIAALNENHRWSWDECSAVADTVETRAATPADIDAIDRAFARETQVYVEVPWENDVTPFIAALARVGRRAKLRTGGVTPDAFPSSAAVIAFVECCVQHGVAFKATAGLHHALCGSYPLTYETGALQSPMFGYLNLFLLTALTVQGHERAVRERVLAASDATAFTFADDAVTWNDVRVDRNELARVRERVAISFGSCSFTEPVQEVRALGAW